MERTFRTRSWAIHGSNVTLARGIRWGLAGGLIGTVVMDLILMGGFWATGRPALIFFSIIGNTAAGFFSLFRPEMAGGIPVGAAAHYAIGPLMGALLGIGVARVDALRVDTLKKGIVLAVLYVEILSQPMLAMTPILLKMSAADTLQWYAVCLLTHLIFAAVLGSVLRYGLGPAAATSSHWWKGAHGEWYVVAQVVLVVLVFFGPRTMEGWITWSDPFAQIGSIAGAILFLAGLLLIIAGIFKLGPNLTAVPFPKDQATLVETGPYGFVRHPMYSGGVLLALGWALWVHGWLTIGYALILFLFFDGKSRREEQWLKDKFPGYADYQRRVRKLIPYLY